MRGWRARLLAESGDWDGAASDAECVLRRPGAPAVIRLPALGALARLRIAPLVAEPYELPLANGSGEAIGELALWLRRAGRLSRAPANTPAPWRDWIDGRWERAASAWEQLGRPYERADALLDGDEAAQRTALELFLALGATPAARIARRRLEERGARSLPRGPQRIETVFRSTPSPRSGSSIRRSTSRRRRRPPPGDREVGPAGSASRRDPVALLACASAARDRASATDRRAAGARRRARWTRAC
jgi:hypothetical protein